MRIPELDGVRGLAAMVVLMHHALLVMPWAAVAYFHTGTPVPGAQFWATYSPLHVFWVGPEAVILFFVLSGIVVSLPFLQVPRRVEWRAYYPSRLVRLYVPVAASVVLAVLWYVLVSREADGDDSAWIKSHDGHLTPAVALRALALLDGTEVLNSPLWSLRWEVWFSLLLPVYVVFARSRKLRWINPVAAFVVLVLADANPQFRPVFYLASFAVGVCLAAFLGELRAMCMPTWSGWMLLALVVLAMTWRWTALGLGLVGPAEWWPTAAVFGSTALLVLAITWGPARRFFGSPALLWCGALSFSLYLVHEPLIVSLAHVMPSGVLWLVPVVGIAASIPLAMVFFRWVEAPSHRLAKRCGQMAAQWRRTSLTPVSAEAPAVRLGVTGARLSGPGAE